VRLWIVSAVGLLLAGGMALAQDVAPLGGQFQINSYTTGPQSRSRVASDGRGDFVVVWYGVGSYGTDTSYSSIQARRFRANGVAKGIDFQVNTYTHSIQDWPNVAVGPQEDFVVVWQSMYSEGTDARQSIHGQRFADSGTPIGSQFQVNSYTTDAQVLPRASLDPQGRFVVVWMSLGSYGTDNSGGSAQGQRFDDSGTPDGGQFQVNTYWTDWQRYPAVAADGQGDFVVVWQSKGSDGTDNSQASIQAQRFDDAGALEGEQFQVNSYVTSLQYRPALAVNGLGSFVVAWESDGSDGTDTDAWSVQAQRFDDTGTPQGDQFQVNTYTTNNQSNPAVGLDSQGAFVAVWESRGSHGTDTDDLSVQAQFYDASGKPVGGEFQVNSYTLDKQRAPSVTPIDPEGNFVVVWESLYSDGTDTDWSVQAQRFASRALPGRQLRVRRLERLVEHRSVGRRADRGAAEG